MKYNKKIEKSLCEVGEILGMKKEEILNIVTQIDTLVRGGK